MKNTIKKISKYSVILLTSIIMLSSLMLLTIATIPREKVEKNIIESIPEIKSETEFKRIKPTRYNTYLHVYADEMILNMIYCMDTNKPVKSMFEAKYYQNKIEEPSLEEAIENKSNGNMEYIRYWHGSMTIIRILLMFFNIKQIYNIFAIILAILLITVIIMLIKKKQYILIFATIVGLIATSSIYVPFCLEYVWTYLVMLITAILAIKLENKRNKYINILMFETGIITCFFDFLSTETITFLIPIIYFFTIRYKEKRIVNIKTEAKQIVKWISLWLAGYSLMWGAKWLLASIILNINALDYVVDKAIFRINGSYFGKKENMLTIISEALKKNFLTIYPFFFVKEPLVWWIIGISIVIIISVLAKRDKEEWKKAGIVLALGVIPYIRYIVLASHSRSHYIFTFRAQLATIISVIIAIYIIIDKKRMKKEL